MKEVELCVEGWKGLLWSRPRSLELDRDAPMTREMHASHAHFESGAKGTFKLVTLILSSPWPYQFSFHALKVDYAQVATPFHHYFLTEQHSLLSRLADVLFHAFQQREPARNDNSYGCEFGQLKRLNESSAVGGSA